MARVKITPNPLLHACKSQERITMPDNTLREKLARKQGKMSDKETSDMLGVGQTIIYLVRTGKREWSPTLAKALGVKKPPVDGRYRYRRAAEFKTAEDAKRFDQLLSDAGYSNLTELVREWSSKRKSIGKLTSLSINLTGLDAIRSSFLINAKQITKDDHDQKRLRR